MRYLFFLFLIYWVYERFFAAHTPPLKNSDSNPKQNDNNTQQKQPTPSRFNGGEFIDYEEIKDK